MGAYLGLNIRIVLLVASALCGLLIHLQGVNEEGAGPSSPAISRTDASALASVPRFEGSFINDDRQGLMSHVSSAAPIGDGRIAAVWYSGTREGAADVSIYYSEYSPGKGWSDPSVLIDRQTAIKELGQYVRKLGNAVIFRDTNGRLWLFYATVFAGGWSGTSISYKRSDDLGRTWGRSRKIVLGPFFNLTHNLKNKPILLKDGSFLIPVYHEFIRKISCVLWFRPDDRGGTHSMFRISSEGREIQPALIPEEGGRILALMRNAEKGRILASRSLDMGRTWGMVSELSVPNPNSGLDAVRIDSCRYLGIGNNSPTERSDLSLFGSEDCGNTWRVIARLEHREGGEFSYPSIVRSEDGLFHITYTYDRKRIRHVVFNEAWLKKASDGIH